VLGDKFALGETVSFLIDNDAKDRVRTAIDIVDLIGSYLQLRRQGANYVGLCPFHEDRRPSFNVNPTRQTWKCWVCDLGGDVFSFLMEKERITFPEALQMLADRAGVQLSSPRSGGRSSGSADHKKAMYEAMAWACQQYHHFLLKEPAAESARQYLQQRGISAASIQRFQLGFAPEQWSWLLDLGGQRGLKAELLEAVGLLVKSEQGKRYDRFRGRVLFPIRDPQGRPIAVGGRVLPGAVDQAKYVNCNETRLYQKSQQLYGLDIAREAIQKQRTAIVMEGYTDVIMAHQHGVSHAVAVCGTALGESHIRLLRRYCDRVVLLLDGDEAGQKRTNEILELFIAAQLDLRVATLPDALDPCDFLMERGEAALSEIVSQAVDALQHKLNLLCQGLDPLVDTHRANVALEQMLELLAKAPRSSLLSDEAARLRQDQILMRLARQFAVDSAALRRRLEDLRRVAQARLRPREQPLTGTSARGPSTNQASAHQAPANRVAAGWRSSDAIAAPTAVAAYRFQDLAPIDRELLEILVLHAELVPFALERFPLTALVSEPARQLWQAYMDLELQGYSLDFSSILSAIENVTLKNVLVTLAEEASEKAEIVTLNADQRLHALCERLSREEQMIRDQQRLRELESKNLSPQEEMDLLQQVIDQARVRQGLLPPKG
jgi:DNA primase